MARFTNKNSVLKLNFQSCKKKTNKNERKRKWYKQTSSSKHRVSISLVYLYMLFYGKNCFVSQTFRFSNNFQERIKFENRESTVYVSQWITSTCISGLSTKILIPVPLFLPTFPTICHCPLMVLPAVWPSICTTCCCSVTGLFRLVSRIYLHFWPETQDPSVVSVSIIPSLFLTSFQLIIVHWWSFSLQSFHVGMH